MVPPFLNVSFREDVLVLSLEVFLLCVRCVCDTQRLCLADQRRQALRIGLGSG